MTIAVGDQLPNATLIFRSDDGPSTVSLHDKLKGRKVVIFSLPGPFTPTCSNAHMPSFVRTAHEFHEKGVDEIICITVSDVHVLAEWGKASGATEAGITLLADADSSYTKSIGMAFDAPPVGFYGRPVRHAMIVDDGIVTVLQVEESRSVCEMTGGETLLELV